MTGDLSTRPVRIESLDDPRVLPYRDVANPSALERAGLFVAEGRFVVARLVAQPRYRTRSLLLTPTAFDAIFGGDGGPSPSTYIVDPALMKQIVGFNIHRGCLALAERPARRSLDELPLDALTRVLVLEGVNNPDNVGGLFRSAAAFGVEAVVLGPACGDPLYRKAIRTSMGASLQVPFVDAGTWPDALVQLRAAALRLIALTPRPDARPLDEWPRARARVALLVGTEGAGLTRAALDAADEHVRIPTRAEVDSLNVTVAASIAMHHFFAEGHGSTADGRAPAGEV